MYSPSYPSAAATPKRTSVPSPAHIRSTIAALATPPEELRAVASYHKALSDPTRLRLMQRLAEGPATGKELTSYVDLSQPLVSFHLQRLKAAGVVQTQRVGREVICTLSRDVVNRFRAREGE